MAAIDDGVAAPPALPSQPSAKAARGSKGMNWWGRLKRDRTLVIMTLPAVILLAVFSYGPMFGLFTAFQAYDIYNGFTGSPFIGLDQFQRLFGDPLFWHSMENTLVLSAVQLVLYFPIPILLALLLNSIMSTKIRSFVQAIVYLPHFFGWVLVVTIFQEMLGGAGMLNTFLRQHDMATWDIMTNPDTFKYLVTAQAVWKEAGWGIVIFLAALAAIDTSLYEAAAADGANRWRRLWHITLPGMRSVIILLLVLRLGNALSIGFEQFILQRQAVGRDAAEVLDTFSYYYGVVGNNFSYGTAAGLFKGIISVVLLIAANKVAHMFGEDGFYRR
ncbi:putative aldouronate transport system permease protein [Hamadaea flava]|uniref:ABC transporter permease n=1 Tax=Hamadaea flava TaxID=1742688 RepID=A0ABV8M250_9ACTN|nr:ABC transporter permease subunit [Hamadaea flava]MCP2326767.1 putative aldouronate transport system permease protein [Hamadaea flava]